MVGTVKAVPRATGNELVCYIHYHEYDYNKERPTLVIQTEYDSIGYELDPISGVVLGRVCICAAPCDNACVCGGSG